MSFVMASEQLVGEARERRARSMEVRERTITTVSAVGFLAIAIAVAVFVPDERNVSLLLTLALVVGYASILDVRFEFGGYYGSPEQLAFVPLLLLGPLPLVPLLVAAAGILSTVPEILRSEFARDRWLDPVADTWPYLAAPLVLAAFAPGKLDDSHLAIYALAGVAHFGADFAWTAIRNQLYDGLPLSQVARGFAGTARVDAILTPLAFVLALAAVNEPIYLVAIGPLVWLFHLFSIDRRERYSKTLELQRAYRGTVMLLSDVVESDDSYTAEHSRSVVELANAVADELGVDDDHRQEPEFAALLHDVGKIAIPKEILNKPAALTDHEFEVMKTHTIEGQFMLDRVGGLLGRVGEIVRSCHERWDGTGYPDGLMRDEIPFEARIVFCCDAYHAMTSDRVYRRARSREAALAELRANAGAQFDPVVVEALCRVVARSDFAGSAVDEVRALLAGAPTRPEVGAGRTH
jgi:HD-GYP domain-containing protein (c-di-GMP phosphodiesterase class II)